MKRLSSVLCVLPVAFIGLVLSTEVGAEDPPPLPSGAAIDPTKLPPLPEELRNAPGSTRLEVPSGADIKITIEVLGKSKPLPPQLRCIPSRLNLPHPRRKRCLMICVDPRRSPSRRKLRHRRIRAFRPPTRSGTWRRIKPEPLPPIPHDPPPHEGAMVELPYVAEPPDLIRVEVLQTLPGRPISGEN